jgi:hypothetical protein
VRRWRAEHPGYGRRGLQEASPLQERSLSQVSDSKEKPAPLGPDPLQELSRVQPLVLMGLIAHLTDATLQEDIARASLRFQQLAHDLLHLGETHGDQTTASP